MILALLLAACGPDPDTLPQHTVIYGGDLMFGRRVNEALWDDEARADMLGDVAPVLRDADLALVNGEGVISSGGQFGYKPEPRPHLYRAHPRMMSVLQDAGIDVVAMGNNHVGDYGPDAIIEELDLLHAAGIGTIGAGEDRKAAMRPSYRTVGDTTVAFVGADLTYYDAFAASKTRAGSLFFKAVGTDRNHDRIVKVLARIAKKAREHADVVLLSPHWGDSWIEDPAPGLRALGPRLIRAGYDAILGHSAHWIHGVELVDGKPILYDAGNVLLDYGGGDDAHKDVLWQLSVSRAGVHEVTAIPIWLGKNHTSLATGERQQQILSMLTERSERLGSTLDVHDGRATLRCEPGGVHTHDAPPPAPPAVTQIRHAPSDTILDTLPADATPVDLRYEDGIRMVGYKVLVDALTVPKSGQVIITWWTADRPPQHRWNIVTEAHRDGRRVFAEPHIPADWMLPTTRWPVGKIVTDWTLVRLPNAKAGEVEFFAGLSRERHPVAPLSSDQPLHNDLLRVGRASHSASAPKLMREVERYEQERPPPAMLTWPVWDPPRSTASPAPAAE